MPAKREPPAPLVSIAPLRVNIAEAARVIGLSRATVYKLIRSGELRPVKFGSRTLLSVTELLRYVAAADDAAARSPPRMGPAFGHSRAPAS